MPRKEHPAVAHARRELELIGEEEDVVALLVKTVRVFESYGHSGASHQILADVLCDLLHGKELSPITSDSSEWNEVDSGEEGVKMWQNIRNSRYMSFDGGRSYSSVEDPTRTVYRSMMKRSNS